MKLKEITAAEFKDKLKDPEVAEVNVWAKKIDKAINAQFHGDWKVEVTIAL